MASGKNDTRINTDSANLTWKNDTSKKPWQPGSLAAWQLPFNQSSVMVIYPVMMMTDAMCA